MREFIYRTHFKKDLKNSKKSGKNLEKLKKVICLLENEASLPFKFHDHKLSGKYHKHRECHIEPDWLLIYKIEKNFVILERLGSHSELF